MTICSTAKINLYLEITGRDPNDGYHTIDSLFQEISLADEIEVEEAGRDEVVFENMTVDGVSTVEKALRMFKARFEVSKCFRIVVRKTIPIGAGLGGGSSNAAFTLKALAQMNGVDPKCCAEIAPKIGSDVPFFLKGGCCRVGGKGEVVTTTEIRLDTVRFIVAFPGFGVSTKWAYSLISEYGRELDGNRIKKSGQDIEFLRRISYNRFEDCIFEKEGRLAEFKKALETVLKADITRMSGSGSSLFFVYRDAEEAERDFRKLKQLGYTTVYLCHPVYRDTDGALGSV